MKLKDLLHKTYNSKEELKNTLLNKIEDVNVLKIVDKTECIICTQNRSTTTAWLKIFTEEKNYNYMLHYVKKDGIIKVKNIEQEHKLEHYSWKV